MYLIAICIRHQSNSALLYPPFFLPLPLLREGTGLPKIDCMGRGRKKSIKGGVIPEKGEANLIKRGRDEKFSKGIYQKIVRYIKRIDLYIKKQYF